MSEDTPGDDRATADQSGPSERRDVEEHAEPHQEAEGTAAERQTAPQQSYTNRHVGIGFAVLAVGLVVVFAIPLLVT